MVVESPSAKPASANRAVKKPGKEKLVATRISLKQWRTLRNYCTEKQVSAEAFIGAAIADRFKKEGLPW